MILTFTHEWGNEWFTWRLRQAFPPCFCHTDILPRSAWHWEIPTSFISAATIETLTSLSQFPAAAEETQCCQHSNSSFLMVPWSHAISAAGEGFALQVLGKVILLPYSPTSPSPLLPSISCSALVHGVASGDNGHFRAETLKLSTCKEKNPHRGSRRHIVCPSFRGGITAG